MCSPYSIPRLRNVLAAMVAVLCEAPRAVKERRKTEDQGDQQCKNMAATWMQLRIDQAFAIVQSGALSAIARLCRYSRPCTHILVTGCRYRSRTLPMFPIPRVITFNCL